MGMYTDGELMRKHRESIVTDKDIVVTFRNWSHTRPTKDLASATTYFYRVYDCAIGSPLADLASPEMQAARI